MLGDRKADQKWLTHQNREGAKSLQSLTEGCPSHRGSLITALLSQILILVSDLALFASMKIGGNGIQKVLKGRRGVSLIRDIGLRLSTAYMLQERLSASMLVARFRHLSLRQELQLPLLTHPERLSVSEGQYVGKSFMLSEKLGEAVVVQEQIDGQNTQV